MGNVQVMRKLESDLLTQNPQKIDNCTIKLGGIPIFIINEETSNSDLPRCYNALAPLQKKIRNPNIRISGCDYCKIIGNMSYCTYLSSTSYNSNI